MQKLMGLLRRCVEDYQMIEAGDAIAVGVSGGKDSLVLLKLLAGLREYHNQPFTLEAITIDMGFGMDYSGIQAMCDELNVPYTVVKTEIGPIIFDYRKEKNPCSMCAKMRRGALNQAIKERGMNKLALGHHYDDAVETFVMSLLYEGRISCFQPVTNLDRMGVIQIRPMLYLSEKTVDHFAQRMELPVISTAALWTSTPSGRRSRNWSMNFRADTRISRSGCSAPCSAIPLRSGSPRADTSVRKFKIDRV